VAHGKSTRENNTLARHEADDTGEDGRDRMIHHRRSQEAKVNDLTDNDGGKLPHRSAVELRTFSVSGE